MVSHRYIDAICILAAAAAVVLVLLIRSALPADGRDALSGPDYAALLFDSGSVHTVELRVDDWEAFVENAPEEEYISCTAVIDGETFYNVGLRAKGNNSRNLTQEYGLSRYSLKLEFDHFTEGGSYHGLDKLSLDASFQDNSYLKTYLAYDMMRFMGVPAPLCSYARVAVNGADWGLFLAVEEPEEAFARRNFGADHGLLYKPDYRSLDDPNEDVALKYTGDDPENYRNIFENAKFRITDADKKRLIEALKILNKKEGKELESAVNVDGALRYFAAQVFVMNWDSYPGRTGHNYFLYEEDGVLSILPWDYNLAFGTYALGMTDPIRDPGVLINYPVDTPAEGSVMKNRPLYHNLMQNQEYFEKYRGYLDFLLSEYFENGRFETMIRQMAEQIAPYVRQDPTAFCSYEDHRRAVDTLVQVCLLRTQSVRGQLSGLYPSSLKEQEESSRTGVDASSVDLESLGNFGDLKNAKAGQDEAMRRVMEQSEKHE